MRSIDSQSLTLLSLLKWLRSGSINVRRDLRRVIVFGIALLVLAGAVFVCSKLTKLI